MDAAKTGQTIRRVIAAVAALLLGVAVWFAVWFGASGQDTLPPQTAGATPPAMQPVPPQALAPLPPAPQAAVVPDMAPSGPIVPTFDTFRLDPTGNIVIAGRAEPGANVSVMLGDAEIAQATADAQGSFVVLTTAGPSALPRRLILRVLGEGGAVFSRTSYLVAPIDPPATPTTPVVVADAAPSPVPVPVPVPVDVPQPLLLEADATGVRVVPGDVPLAAVALDAITYDPDGAVQLAGRALGDGSVQVYIDNAPIATATVRADAGWQIVLPDVAPGRYTLRIDELDSAGAVVSRIETPFQREQVANVAAALDAQTSAPGFDVAVLTVQPGATLWAIAAENLGSGVFYVAVFEANRDQIRDPDLIYPGQVFRIPQSPQ